MLTPCLLIVPKDAIRKLFVPLPKQTCWSIKLKNCLERAFVAHRYEQVNRNTFPSLTLRPTVPLESYTRYFFLSVAQYL